MLATLIRAGFFVLGMGGGALLSHLYNVVIDNPTIIRIERETAASEAEAAAARATQAERDRQYQIAEEAWRAASREAQIADEFQRARIELLQRENAAYEAERLAAGLSIYRFTQPDLDYLDGLLERQPRAAQGGGR